MAVAMVSEDRANQPNFLLSQYFKVLKVTIDATATDSRNTGQTYILSPGLALGIITAQSTYTGYDPNGSDGTETAMGVLLNEVDLKNGDPTATAVDTEALMVWNAVCGASAVVDEDGTAIDASGKADLKKNGSGLGFIEFE
tara:strand:- start:879 stop:1301 length:423 start_codon:yes stop_codon:yes gene_type:complete